MKILFLAANPVDVVTQLRSDQEFREIEQRIRSAPLGNQIELVPKLAVRPGDLQGALLKHKPDIVHFSGHCSPSSGIILEDEDGNRKVVSREALADLFRILKGKIRLVVLNACYAKEQAQLLTEVVDFTIGIDGAIQDRAAIIFSGQFYQSLAFGCSLREAVELATNQLKVEGIEMAESPILLERRGANASEFRIAEAPGDIVDGDDREPQNLFRSYLLYALLSCSFYASLYAEALVLEVAYDFDRYSRTVLKVMPLAFAWILATSLVGLVLEWRWTAHGRMSGLWGCLAIFLAASSILFVILTPILPSTAVTQASFQTHTAQAAYIKDSGVFLMLAILFIILPLHAVLSLEREINAGRANAVLTLLDGDRRSVVPYGALYIKPRSLGFVLTIIIIWNLIVRAYVLDQLAPSPYMNLFMKAYYVHLFLFLALPAYCLSWYYRAVNEIKRRCVGSGVRS